MKLVSVIIPTKNNEKILDRCLSSIKNQSYKNIELVVVDNNSTDKTKKIASRYTNVILNKGPERVAQRNFAARIAKGDFLFFIDSDMELDKDVIKECVELAKEKEAIVIEENNIGNTFWTKCRNFERKTYVGDEYIVAARFFKKNVFFALGGYDENLIINEDISLHHHLRTAGYKIGRINARINHYEDHTLKDVIKKNFYYGKTLRQYFKKNPSHAVKHHSIYRLNAYLRNWKLFLKDPVYGFGSVLRKGIEYSAAFLGLISSYFSK